MAGLVRSGEVSPKDLLNACFERIDQRDPALNAVIHRMYEQALASLDILPDGPLKGVPFLVKDLVSDVKGEPLRHGARYWKDFVSKYDAELVVRYRKAGLVLAGKTNTPEFGLQPTTEPLLFGPTHNPWDLTRTPGGSSGGSAAAVSAGYVPAAHAGDGGGSIRIPASCCGLFGMKPTRARTPAGPLKAPGWNGATVEHVVTRSVRDSAVILDATAGPDTGAPYYPPPPERPFLDEVSRDPKPLRIAFTGRPFLSDSVDPECLDALSDAASLLESLGHTVVEDAPVLEGEAFADAFVIVLAGEISSLVRAGEQATGRRARYHDFEPVTWALYNLGMATTAADFQLANRRIALETRKVGQFFQGYDVLLTPTLARLPLKLGTLAPSRIEEVVGRMVRTLRAGKLLRAAGAVREMATRSFDFVPFTPVFNATGQPAMSVPLFWKDHLPVGVQLVGPYAGESLLFQLAGQLERARPWFDRRPPDFSDKTHD
ncbi:MAG: amidase [Rhodothermales bacterium]|nr:amidase [Rhodothermales bacterium]